MARHLAGIGGAPDAETSASMVPATEATLKVLVFMFGMICRFTGERQAELEIPAAATVGDVIKVLGARYGDDFMNVVMRAADCKASHTMLAVDGRLVRDLTLPVAPGSGMATVEIILLPGHEGG